MVRWLEGQVEDRAVRVLCMCRGASRVRGPCPHLIWVMEWTLQRVQGTNICMGMVMGMVMGMAMSVAMGMEMAMAVGSQRYLYAPRPALSKCCCGQERLGLRQAPSPCHTRLATEQEHASRTIHPHPADQERHSLEHQGLCRH